MRVLVLGLGPVGLATTWDLLRRGNSVVAFDKNPELVRRLLSGEFKRSESLSEDLSKALKIGTLTISDVPEFLPPASHILICVGTPSSNQGFDLKGLQQALLHCQRASQNEAKLLIVRSTLEPKTLDDAILPALTPNTLFSYYPEFLREKSAKEDLLSPPLLVAAHACSKSRQEFLKLFPEVVTEGTFAELETLKLACNAFHALKVSFANEIGELCDSLEIDGKRVMKLFCQDIKLNLSANYLMPGNPFGGPCLDKDLLALEHTLDEQALGAKLLRAIRQSNNLHKLTHYEHSLCSSNQERIGHYQHADQ